MNIRKKKVKAYNNSQQKNKKKNYKNQPKDEVSCFNKSSNLKELLKLKANFIIKLKKKFFFLTTN